MLKLIEARALFSGLFYLAVELEDDVDVTCAATAAE
jgi:hypothetical protein